MHIVATQAVMIHDRLGYVVLGLDYFHGDDASFHTGKTRFEAMPWAIKKHEDATKETPGWIEAVRQRYGTVKSSILCPYYVLIKISATSGEGALYFATGCYFKIHWEMQDCCSLI